MRRIGVGKFLIKKDQLGNLVKKLKVPVTISPVPPLNEEVIVVVNMGPNIGPTRYREQCERVAAVIQGEDGKNMKKNKSEVVRATIAVAATVAVFVIIWVV
jgi:hypothetical protein